MSLPERFPGRPTFKRLYETYKRLPDARCTNINGVYICEHEELVNFRRVPAFNLYDCRRKKEQLLCRLDTRGYWYRPTKVYIDYFGVEPVKHGYGSLLYNKLENYLKNKGVTRISLHSFRESEGFWQKMGFKRVFSEPNKIDWRKDPERAEWAQNFRLPIYEKELPSPKDKKPYKWYNIEELEMLARRKKK